MHSGSQAEKILQSKRPIGRPRYRWENDIKMDPKGIGCDTINEINMAQERHTWDM